MGLSGETLAGQESIEEDRSVTCRDIKLIMPTVIILIFTLFVMVTVIPYAFSSVIKQIQGVWAMEEQSKIISRRFSFDLLNAERIDAALQAGAGGGVDGDHQTTQDPCSCCCKISN